MFKGLRQVSKSNCLLIILFSIRQNIQMVKTYHHHIYRSTKLQSLGQQIQRQRSRPLSFSWKLSFKCPRIRKNISLKCQSRDLSNIPLQKHRQKSAKRYAPASGTWGNRRAWWNTWWSRDVQSLAAPPNPLRAPSPNTLRDPPHSTKIQPSSSFPVMKPPSEKRKCSPRPSRVKHLRASPRVLDCESAADLPAQRRDLLTSKLREIWESAGLQSSGKEIVKRGRDDEAEVGETSSIGTARRRGEEETEEEESVREVWKQRRKKRKNKK